MNVISNNIIINSRFRNSGTATDFRIASRERINPKKLRVSTVSIPNVFYNLRSYSLSFTSSVDGPIVIALSPDVYTASTLKAALEAAINPLITGTVTVTFDSDTQRVDFNFTAITASVSQADLDASALWDQLGFNVPQGLIDPLFGDGAYNLSGPAYIYIHSTAFSNDVTKKTEGTNVGARRDDIIAAIPVNVVSGQIITSANIFTQFYEFDSPRGVTEIDLVLKDEFGNILDLRGQEWSCVINYLCGE